MSESSSLVLPRKVTGGGEGADHHGGLAWLGVVGDRVGLSDWFACGLLLRVRSGASICSA